MINVMLIGLGLHARRAHYPAIESLGESLGTRVAAVVDLAPRAADIFAYLRRRDGRPDEVVLLPDRGSEYVLPTPTDIARLDLVCDRLNIQAVVISTEPLAHCSYAGWALRRGLSILVDKPVTARPDVVHDARQAEALLTDFDSLSRTYSAAVDRGASCVASVVAHRRYHPGFQRARQLVGDVYRRTGCPVTSVTAEYGDGEWRMPWEVRNQTYHPFRLGYGMLCHSGYHAFDAAAWLAEAGHGPRHRPDSIEAVTHLVLPADLDTQLDQHTLETVFGDLPSSPKVAPTRRPLGEIDAHALIAMRRGDRVITTLGIHAIHNSLSARAWPSSAGRNLYTGNGRVKQEIYSVHQGPFQALKLLVWQSAPDQEGAVPDLYSIGGDRHFELHVFRNQALFPDWEAYERFDLSDLETVSYDDLLVGPGKVAIMSEFLGAVTGRVDRNALRSDLRSHRTATAMLSATYQSQCASVAGGRTTGVTVPLEGGHGRRGLSLAAAG